MNQIQVTYAFLDFYKYVDALSSLLLVVMLVMAMSHPMMGALSVFFIAQIVAALAIKYYTFRLSIDRQLFDDLRRVNVSELSERAVELDKSLQSLHLLPTSKAGRDWRDRCLATIRMTKIHFALLIIQILVTLPGVLYH